MSGIENYDIVTILSNLLDNAVDAAKISKEKHIAVETDFRNDFSIIIVSNSCDVSPSFNDSELPLTTKKHK